MPHILLSWVGNADLNGAAESPPSGPLLRVLMAEAYDAVYLLHNQPTAQLQAFLEQVRLAFSGQVLPKPVRLTSPIHFGDIYTAFDTRKDCERKLPLWRH